MVTGAMSDHQSQSRSTCVPARKIRVVLVDDSALSRRALVSLLVPPFHVQIAGQAEDGLKGFALAAELRPDLVITDLNMPGLAGFQLAELLRHNYPAMRSIIISAQDGPALRAASLHHGADAFIPKQRLAHELPSLLTRLFPETQPNQRSHNANNHPENKP